MGGRQEDGGAPKHFRPAAHSCEEGWWEGHCWPAAPQGGSRKAKRPAVKWFHNGQLASAADPGRRGGKRPAARGEEGTLRCQRCCQKKAAYPKDGSPAKEFAVREADGKTLTESRRQKLLSIRKREEMKDVLVKKLIERAGPKCKQENVEAEVDSFLGHASITENNLKKLEKKVVRKANDDDAGSHISAYSKSSSMRSHGSRAGEGGSY